MRSLRKIAALILALTMMFALCSCGKKSEEAKDDAAGSLKESALEQVLKKDASVEGTWNGSYNLGEVMGQAFDSEEFEGMDPSQYFDFEGLELPFILELNSDKTFTLQFDVDGFLSIVDDYIGVLAEGFSSFMYDMLESELEAEGM